MPEFTNPTTITVVADDDLTGVIRTGDIPRIELDLPEMLDAPVHRGDVIGTAYLIAGDDIVAKCSIVSNEDAQSNDLMTKWKQFWRNWLLIQNKRPENISPGALLFG